MFILKELPSMIMIGKWSELRVMRLHYSESKAMWEEAIVRWERWGPCERYPNSVIRVPLAYASVHVV